VETCENTGPKWRDVKAELWNRWLAEAALEEEMTI
jgi:hypothetical protein